MSGYKYRDFFFHDDNMSCDSKVLALRKRFGLQGYAVYCMILELLRKEEQARFGYMLNFEHDYYIVKYSSYCSLEKTEFVTIVNFCIDVKLLKKHGNFIFSPGFTKRINQFLANRQQKVLAGKESARVRGMSKQTEDLSGVRPHVDSSVNALFQQYINKDINIYNPPLYREEVYIYSSIKDPCTELMIIYYLARKLCPNKPIPEIVRGAVNYWQKRNESAWLSKKGKPITNLQKDLERWLSNDF